MSLWFYDELSNQPSDKLCGYLDLHYDCVPVVFINNLPLDVLIIQESSSVDHSLKVISNNLPPPIDFVINNISNIVGIVKGSQGKLTLNSKNVKDGDIFYFKNTANTMFVCPSYRIVKRHGNVLIGSVSTFTGTFKRDISAGGDLSSVNFRNLLPWPLLIKTKGKVVAYVDQNVDLGSPNHHGDLTVSPSVYYDNLNQGVNIGTHFDVYIVFNKGNKLMKEVFFLSFIIHDNDVHDIFIGNVTSQIDKKNLTDVNSDISDYNGNYSGRAIYRLGGDFQRIIEKNSTSNCSQGIDKNRNTLYHRNIRSTVPLARYMKVSGENVSKIM